jgi:hypothetical protein
MLRDKPLSHLLLILFTSLIGANIIGEALRYILHAFGSAGTTVEHAMLDYVRYNIGPHTINLIILSFSFDLSLHFNAFTMLGIFVGWYYFRYSY